MDYEELKGEIYDCSESCKMPPEQMLLGRGVPNEKNYTADIMFIGLGPNPNYNEKETPPGGRKVFGDYSSAGKITQIMNSVQKQMNVTFWLTNSVKCSCSDWDKRFSTCKKWLEKEIAIINPKLLILFGGKTQKNLNVYISPLSENHGMVTSYYSSINEKSYPCILSYHFAAWQKKFKWATQEKDELEDKIVYTIEKINSSEKYKPERIKFLLIAEAPPRSLVSYQLSF